MRMPPASLDKWLRAAGLSLICVLCALVTWHPLGNDSDIWSHAAIGRWISEHQWHAPKHTLLLWSANSPWIAHSWLSECLIYLLMSHAGDTTGTTIALVATGALAFIGCWLLWTLCCVTGRSFGLAVLAFTLAIFDTETRLLPRPEIFSIFCFLLLLYLLVKRNVSDTKTSPLKMGMILVPMFALWTNLHGAVIVGLMAIWIYALLETAQDQMTNMVPKGQGENTGAKPPAQAVTSLGLLAVAAACSLATLANPYGYHYYSIYQAVRTLTFSHIVEWRPLLGSPYVTAKLGPIELLVAAAIILWRFTPGRRWSHLALLIVFTGTALEARRNIAYMNFAALAVIVPYLRSLAFRPDEAPASKGRRPIAETTPSQPRRGRKRRSDSPSNATTQPARIWTNVAWALLAGMVYVLAVYLAVAGSAGAFPHNKAVRLCAAIRRLGITGRAFNDYDNASYLEWKLGNSPVLYIDGINAYPDSVSLDYSDILAASPRGLKILDDNQVNCIIGRGPVPDQPEFPNLYLAIAESPSWAIVYYGADGPVWVRRIPQYAAICNGIPTYQGGPDLNQWMLYLKTAPLLHGQ